MMGKNKNTELLLRQAQPYIETDYSTTSAKFLTKFQTYKLHNNDEQLKSNYSSTQIQHNRFINCVSHECIKAT